MSYPPISDEELDEKGTYFVKNNIYNRYGITFEEYLVMEREGTIASFIRLLQFERKVGHDPF